MRIESDFLLIRFQYSNSVRSPRRFAAAVWGRSGDHRLMAPQRPQLSQRNSRLAAVKLTLWCRRKTAALDPQLPYGGAGDLSAQANKPRLPRQEDQPANPTPRHTRLQGPPRTMNTRPHKSNSRPLRG